jgi:hypothetical protein
MGDIAMDQAAVEQLLDELLESLEALETQNMAILQFLKDNGTATEDQLAPYLHQASAASNVKWQAGRMRIKRLLSSAMKSPEEEAEKASDKSTEAAPEEEGEKPSNQGREQGSAKGREEAAQTTPDQAQQKPAEHADRSEEEASADRKQTAEQADRSEEHAGRDAA